MGRSTLSEATMACSVSLVSLEALSGHWAVIV